MISRVHFILQKTYNMIGFWEKSVSLLFFIALSLSVGNEETWGGCGKSEGSRLVSANKRTFICIMVGPSGDWRTGINYLRYSFEPKADEYSRFTIENSYNDMYKNGLYSFLSGSGVSVLTASDQALSFLRTTYDRANDRIYPHLTASIDVENGVVKGILWDNACVFCSDDLCVENTFYFNGTSAEGIKEPTKGCYITKDQCDKIHEAGGNECDITIYFTWYGSDENGRPLTSNNKRFSVFNPKNIKDSFKDRLPSINAPDWPW